MLEKLNLWSASITPGGDWGVAGQSREGLRWQGRELEAKGEDWWAADP
jgi:hypothetical protein